MAEKKLTRSQRRRRNERIRTEQAAQFVRRVGPTPGYAKKSTGRIKETEKTPAEKAPPHMAFHDISDPDNAPEIDAEAQRRLTDAAAEVRAENKKERSEELKDLYPKDWKRGGAKRIASCEAEAGRPIDVRTVQRYINAGKQGKQEPQN